MRRALWAAAVWLATAIPAPAGAAEALWLTWNECVLDGTATHNRNNPCTANNNEQVLFASFQLGAPVDSVLGLDLVVDLQQAATALPSWWQLGPGGCRFGALSASFDFSLNTTCADFWLNQQAGGLQGYYNGEPRGAPNQARILFGAAVLPGFGYRSLDASQVWYAAKLVLTNAHTVDPNPCPGCLEPACLVLNSIAVRRQPGAPGGDVFLQVPGSGSGNFCTWQGGGGADCQAVPVRARTWGQIKSLYR